MVLDHLTKVLAEPSPLGGKLLDSISNMSLIRASFTKSGVVGPRPKAEFTPDFSAAD
jgi:hypothetical protein